MADPLSELDRALSPGALLLDDGARAAASGDESGAEPVVPAAVVRAAGVQDVRATLAWAHRRGVPVTPRGAGTGKSGGCVPSEGGVVLDLSAMNRILAVRPEHGWAEAEPGVVTGLFRDEAESRGLFFPPDPASLATCTLGGNVATNAGGPLAVKYGVTGAFVLGLTAVLADGRVIETGRRQPKGVAGYDLTSLLVGSEGTLAVLTGLRLALLPRPAEVRTALLAFADLPAAAAAVAGSRRAGVVPRALELVDEVALDRVRDAAAPALGLDERTRALLLVEVDGPPGTTAAALARFLDALPAPGPLRVTEAPGEAERGALWELRRTMSNRVKRGAAGWITDDVAVPIGSIPTFVERLRGVAERRGITIATYGHAGDGQLHVNVLWDDPGAAASAREAVDEVVRAALELGGTITGEHGVGLTKRRYLPWEQGPDVLALQRALKQAWDPRGILNPGKILPP